MQQVAGRPLSVRLGYPFMGVSFCVRGVMAFCTDRGTFQELYRVWLIVTFGLLAFPVFFLEWLLREEKLDVAKYRCSAFVFWNLGFICELATCPILKNPCTTWARMQTCLSFSVGLRLNGVDGIDWQRWYSFFATQKRPF